MTQTVGYIAATVPAQIVRVSHTTLFHIAMEQFNEPLQWVAIAQLNDTVDPWIFGREDVKIPPVLSTATPDGILGE
jgi:hypothetical protein